MKGMLSFENSHVIKTISNSSNFLDVPLIQGMIGMARGVLSVQDGHFPPVW
jgi:hypothetical protein